MTVAISSMALATAQVLPPPPGGSLIVTLTAPGQGSTVQGYGNFIGADSGAPYSISWDTRKVGNGSHTLTAVAQEALGARWTLPTAR